MIGGLNRVFRRDHIDNDVNPARTHDSAHLRKHLRWRWKMMEGEAANRDIEAGVRKGHSRDIAEHERRIPEVPGGSLVVGALDETVGCVDPDDAPTMRGKGHRYEAGTARDVEHAILFANF